ncbi:TPA: transcription termination/antitermination protein NusA [Candidatus Avacholeplasma faecigallinarum]|nr:transcription termination/antitermination protein NusA [Candidatus Avacholeplasma faecigallinarum]
MINKEFFKNAEDVAQAKGITVEDVYEQIKKGLVNSFKKIYGNTSCRVVINPEKNEILLFSVHKVVENYSEEIDPEQPQEMLLEDAKKIKSSYKVGDIVEQQINIKGFGRTAIGAAKSVYTQGIRTIEREKAYNYFKDLEDEMVTGEVSNIGEKYIVIDLGYNVTSTLPLSELLPNDHFNIGDSIRVYIKKVEQTTKEPKVSISRTDRQLVTRLMENYIPEIKSGIIEIKGIARDPGDRSKIALYSNDPKVDAIGSCVGENGSRIREIVNALGGEKVDLYKWSDQPEELIANSLQPASVTKVLSVDPKTKTSVVVVPDEHLSLAIGKSGQNVRLAVQSCGWKIDIMPTSEAYEKGLLI